jgi:putative transposase
VNFKGAHFPQDIILTGIRWYVAYPLSTRHVEELMRERGIHVDHSTVNRWVIKYSPQLEEAFHRRKRPVRVSWRMDETYIKVKGEWHYLYRAVDKQGQTIDFLLTEQRDQEAALRFLKKAIHRHGMPEKITIDGSEANAAAIRRYNEAHDTAIIIRQVKYLHNMVEIVLTHMTKARGLTVGVGGDRIADCTIAIRDKNAINQELHQGAFLSTRRLGSTGLHPLTTGLHGRPHLGKRLLPIHWSLSWLLLCRQGLVLLFEFLTSPLVFDSRAHALQVRLCQSLELMGHTHLALPQRFFAGLECLGEPIAPRRTLQGLGDPFRVSEEITQVMPDEFITLLGRAVPRRTASVV